jgi:hypothetical protein
MPEGGGEVPTPEGGGEVPTPEGGTESETPSASLSKSPSELPTTGGRGEPANTRSSNSY